MRGELILRKNCSKTWICDKTVKRDLKKLKPYYERMSRHYEDLLRNRLHVQWEAELEDKSLMQRFRILQKKKAEYEKLLKQREYQRHQIFVTMDLTFTFM